MFVIFAAAFAMLLAFAGLSLDGGFIYYERQRAQAAADAGAYAGALELRRGSSAWIVPSAKEDAKLNGFDDAEADVTVTVNNPPANGPRTGDANFVEVIVESIAPTTLLRVVGPTASRVYARAVAGIQPDYGGPCILALNTSARGGITVSGTATLNAPTCDVITRSLDNQAITANGGGCINASTIGFATGTGTTGGYVANGQNCLSPAPIGVIPPEDPYASLTEPNPSDYTKRANNRTTISGSTVTLQPGYYKGGIKITGGDVTLSPGLYIVDGMDVSGGYVHGDGVTVYNTGGGLKNITFNGNTHSELTATNDTSSPYNNILFSTAATRAAAIPATGRSTEPPTRLSRA
ncbi:MAG: pilus assembly protein TadG-related protein [Bryobacterales bacterium]